MSKSREELLPEDDLAFLGEKYPDADVYSIGDEVHVLFSTFALPEAYVPRNADLLVRLFAGYPDVKPDMFWTKQDVKLVSGAWPAASEHHEVPGSGTGVERYEGKVWQRWSRHFGAADWRSGVDGLRNFMATIRRELDRQV